MRARSLKPGFFKNDILGGLPPLVRILYQGLWCLADREGKLQDRAHRIKAEILPYDNCDIDSFLNTLQENLFIVRYSVNNDKYIKINKFLDHQNPHKQEKSSTYPDPIKVGTNSGKRRKIVIPKSEAVGLTPDSGLLTPDSGLLTEETRPSEQVQKKPEEPVRESPQPTVASYFESTYVTRVKKPVLLDRDFTMALREVVRVYGREATCRAIDEFFASSDEWIISRGFPPSIFIKQITTFMAGGTGPPGADAQAIHDLVAKAIGENHG